MASDGKTFDMITCNRRGVNGTIDLGLPDSLYEEFGILFKNHALPLQMGVKKQKYFRAVQNV